MTRQSAHAPSVEFHQFFLDTVVAAHCYIHETKGINFNWLQSEKESAEPFRLGLGLRWCWGLGFVGFGLYAVALNRSVDCKLVSSSPRTSRTT